MLQTVLHWACWAPPRSEGADGTASTKPKFERDQFGCRARPPDVYGCRLRGDDDGLGALGRPVAREAGPPVRANPRPHRARHRGPSRSHPGPSRGGGRRARSPATAPAPAPAITSTGMVEDLADPRRTEPPYVLPERRMLEAWLEFHRTTLLLKCEGLDDAARKSRPVPTSKLSLHGLVRHMPEVERTWFQRTLLGRTQVPDHYP